MDARMMNERHVMGREADATKFREEIALLADKLQVQGQLLMAWNEGCCAGCRS